MAKPLHELLKHPITLPFAYSNPDIATCVCGNILINGEHEYIESNVLPGRFCDLVCLVRADKSTWIGCTIRDEDGEHYSEEKYMKIMEVVAC